MKARAAKLFGIAEIAFVVWFVGLVAVGSLFVTQPACTKQQLHTMSGAFASCAKADLGIVVAPGETLLSDVAQKIEGNAPTLEADFDTLARTLGVAAVQCAIAAVVAVLEPAPAQGQGAGSGSALATGIKPPEPPGVTRALAWSLSAQTKAAP